MKYCTVCGQQFRVTSTDRCPLDGGALREARDPYIGRRIRGQYLVVEKVGAGGMGSVYRCLDLHRSEDVALKFLVPDLALDDNYRQRFLREARAANKIKHPHIIDIRDYGQTDDGLVYLVMEYLQGKGLNVAIAEGHLKDVGALKIAVQVADALARAHELGVVHRDIKPDNIHLLDGYDDHFVKLLDFGLAKMRDEFSLTATGTVFGTPEYMAPEQARGAPVTPAADLYSLGCVLFELLTGQLPFTGSTPDLIIQHMRESAPRVSSRKPNLDPRVDVLVSRLMSKEPTERPPNAYALAQELRAILDDRGERPKEQALRTGATTTQMPFLSAEEAWSRRADLFATLAARAHPGASGPPWFHEAVDGMVGQCKKLMGLAEELKRLSADAVQREDEIGSARARIGNALDELGRDESRIRAQLQSLEPRLEEARQRLSELERPVLRAWGAIPPIPADGPAVTRDVVEALREAGHLAATWLEALRFVEALERDEADWRRQGEDLRFQIAQLKGRFGSLNAESDLDLGGLKEQTARVDRGIRELSDELIRGAAAITEYLMRFPEFRDVLTGVDG
ncbi:MAG: protein kinase [Myxococcota bacterium]